MIKQQQQPPTTRGDLSILSPSVPFGSGSSASARHSSSFKERINQLKAKVKPTLCSLTKQSQMASPKVQSDAKFRNLLLIEAASTDRVLNIEQTLSLGKVDDRVLSERKVVGMKVCYRKQALFAKKQPVIHIKSSEKGVDQKLQGLINAANKLTHNLKADIKEITVLDHQCNRQNNKQNKASNCFEIEDILINNCKARSPMPTQRISSAEQSREFKKLSISRSPMVTNIDVRECSARCAADYSYKACKKPIKSNKDKAKTMRHMKTLSTTYRIK